MNPYVLPTPCLVSYSGGRTSAYMLRMILDAYDGQLPPDVVVTFANTGKERPETLDFVAACQAAWNVQVHWLEYDPEAEHGVRQVSHNSAARNGEPFETLIRRKMGFLPNPLQRYCTQELKIRTMARFMNKVMGYRNWHNAVGLRFDEPGRVGKALDRNELRKDRWTTLCPLHLARVTEDTVLEFWRAQPFDLRLEPWEGNCDLCFLKGAGKICRIMRDQPGLAEWWIRQERESAERWAARGDAKRKDAMLFRKDRPSFEVLFDRVSRQGSFFDFGEFDDHQSCEWACTD